MKRALTFDDVALVPAFNNIPSRLEPDLSTWLCKDLKIDIPILAANMDTVISSELAHVLLENGTMPIFHRFTDFEIQKQRVKDFSEAAFISAGLKDFDKVQELLGLGAVGVCIDIAHGHSDLMLEFINKVANYISCNHKGDEKKIIAGNVCTATGYVDLVNSGASAVKVGVGPGSACITRGVTGFGVPQFTAIQDCAQMAKKYSIPIIADGGIRGSDDIAKALAAGACSVMIGKLFSLTEESAAIKKENGVGGEVFVMKYNDGTLLAKYRGQASEDFQNDFKGGVKEGTVAEGIDFWAPVTGTAQELIDDLVGGLRSAFTYGGARHLDEFQRKAEFVEVTSTYLTESKPRKD